MTKTAKGKCKHCGENINIRNPSGYCDHLYYPENCEVCSAPPETGKGWEDYLEGKYKSLLEEVDDYELFGKPASHYELDWEKVKEFLRSEHHRWQEELKKRIEKEKQKNFDDMAQGKDYLDDAESAFDFVLSLLSEGDGKGGK